MRVVVVTKQGVPVSRDMVLELIRRAGERALIGMEARGALRQAFEDLERELEGYAEELAKAPEWGEVKLHEDAT